MKDFKLFTIVFVCTSIMILTIVAATSAADWRGGIATAALLALLGAWALGLTGIIFSIRAISSARKQRARNRYERR